MVCAYGAWALLWFIQSAARTAMDDWCRDSAINDGNSVYGICASLGPDELLGCDGNYESIFGFPRWRGYRALALGRFFGGQSDAEPILCAALSNAIYHYCRHDVALGCAASIWVKQPTRN